jgi:hypothetical protein
MPAGTRIRREWGGNAGRRLRDRLYNGRVDRPSCHGVRMVGTDRTQTEAIGASGGPNFRASRSANVWVQIRLVRAEAMDLAQNQVPCKSRGNFVCCFQVARKFHGMHRFCALLIVVATAATDHVATSADEKALRSQFLCPSLTFLCPSLTHHGRPVAMSVTASRCFIRPTGIRQVRQEDAFKSKKEWAGTRKGFQKAMSLSV